MITQVIHLLQKEFLLEWRQKYAISSILLYVLATVFVVYIAFSKIEQQVWNALYWIIFLFSGVNAIAKSFLQERSARQLYYYSLADPLAVLWSKMAYNLLLLLGLQLLIFFGLSFVSSQPDVNWRLLLPSVFLGSLAFSIILTFVAAIGSRTHQTAVFMAILSFPLLIPVILMLVPVTAAAFGIENILDTDTRIIGVAVVNLLLLALSGFLFPYLWTD